jgi:cardiolipin synthase (CMP-forming)
MQARDIPNAITIGRILLVPPTAWALVQHHYPLALILFFVAGASDALDGLLAKRYDWSSRLGAILDPLADKALLISC